MREKNIERKLVLKLKSYGVDPVKFEVPGKRGMPDRIILIPGGKVIFAEVKAPGKKLRPLQEKRKRELEELDFEVYVIDSENSIDRLVNRIIWLNSEHTTTKNTR